MGPRQGWDRAGGIARGRGCSRGARGDRSRCDDRGGPRGHEVHLRVGGRSDPQAGALLPDAARRRRRGRPGRRDGGDPLVPAGAGAQAGSVPRRARGPRSRRGALAVTTGEIVLGIAIGVAAGVLSGLFGVGGGIVTTPAIQELLGGTPYVAVGTHCPVAIPTAVVGGYTYARAGEVSWRAIRFAAIPGVAGAAAGAWLTSLIDPHWLLLVTAGLIAWQAVRIGRSSTYRIRPRGSTPGWQYTALGGFPGLVSGLLGVGGCIVFVPLVTTMLCMPLKRALGTSLVLIAIIAIPGTIVHAALGHIDWGIAFVLMLAVIPGARIGASIALGTRERTLRLLVGSFLLVVAVVYGVAEIARLARG